MPLPAQPPCDSMHNAPWSKFGLRVVPSYQHDTIRFADFRHRSKLDLLASHCAAEAESASDTSCACAAAPAPINRPAETLFVDAKNAKISQTHIILTGIAVDQLLHVLPDRYVTAAAAAAAKPDAVTM